MDLQTITDTIGMALWGFCSLVLAVIGVRKSKWNFGSMVPCKELSATELKVLGLAGLAFLIGFVLFAVGTFAFSAT